MKSIAEIEVLTKNFADANNELAVMIEEMETKMNQLKRDYIKKLQPLADKVSIEKALLHEAVDKSRMLFVKPKTYTYYGVKVGIQSTKATIKVINEAKTVELIEEYLPSVSKNMIMTEKSVIKETLKHLSDEEITKINCEKVPALDKVFIKSNRDEVEKFIDVMIKENTEKLTAKPGSEEEREAA